jgi:hypothetical protein
MFRRSPAKAIVSVAVIVLGTIVFSSATWAEGFDKPVRQTILDLGPSPNQLDFPNLHVHLSCYYYPSFMVKQLEDDGNKGALWVSVTRVQQGLAPACTRVRDRADRLIGQKLEMYFMGVKGELVFLLSADGLSGGMYFWTFDSKTQKKIFEDTILDYDHADIDFARNANGQVSLKYLRVFSGRCSVVKDGGTCWNKFKRVTGLKDAPMPKCDYSQFPANPADPSVISYPVEVRLYPHPSSKALSSIAKCWAAD